MARSSTRVSCSASNGKRAPRLPTPVATTSAHRHRLTRWNPLTLVAGLRFDAPSGRWGGELLFTAVGKKDRVSTPERVTADSYSVIDLVGNYDFSESVRLRFGAFNVFDERYARWINISSLNADSTTAIENAQQPGLNFRIDLQIDI